MYTIVSGTDRPGSNSLKVAREYQRLLEEQGVSTALLSLEGMSLQRRDAAFEQMEETLIRPAEKLIFIVPEYNGSYPGVLKMLFDLSKPHTLWWYKKALLTGVATGRSGNVRGMEHLTGVLNYLKVSVYPNLLPLSRVDQLLDAEGRISDAGTLQTVRQQLHEYLHWCN